MRHKAFAGYSITRTLPGGADTQLFIGLDAAQNRVMIRSLADQRASSWLQRRRFLKRAAIVESFSHPNLIRYLKVGREGRIPFIVMPYNESRPLRDLIMLRDAVLQEHAVYLMRQLAGAMYYMHAHGYLHLDFKPENILMDHEGRLVLYDFEWLTRRKGKPLRLSSLPATFAYLPPEALTTRRVDERTDIYSLGVTWYEMLTFHKPYEGDKIDQVRANQIDPDVPPTRLRQHRADLPAAIESLVLKCIAKRPDDRYPSMSLVIRDLESIV